MMERPDRESSGELPRAFEPPLLTGQRRVLVEALSGKSVKSDRPIRMYREALRAIERNDGPEAVHVAAYELREMMESLPAMLDVPLVSHDQLQGKVQYLAERWVVCSNHSACRTGTDWSGVLDQHLRLYIESTTEFFQWREANLPSRQQQAVVILRRLLPADVPMPQPLLDRRLSEWRALRDYFNSLTHHGREANRDQFLERMGELETFLLDHLSPRTFEDQDEIDRLILEAEAQ